MNRGKFIVPEGDHVFEPIPPYHAEWPNDSDKNQALLKFQIQILKAAQRHNINAENRMICLIDCCEYLESLTKMHGLAIWDHSNKEPVVEFQDAFQILIYALGDQGLLYDCHGRMHSSPDPESWKNSEHSCKLLAFSMRDRNFAYLRLQALRRHLDEHMQQRAIWNTSNDTHSKHKISNHQLLTKQLQQLMSKSIQPEIIDKAVDGLQGDRFLSALPSLFLFFALSAIEKGESYDAIRFKSDLKRNRQRFPIQKQPSKIATAH